MTIRCSCTDAEMLAGAIALGEADDAQLDLYRRHLAICGRCRSDLGGERDIARVMATAVAARDAERWEPELRSARVRRPARGYAWPLAAAVAATVAIVLGIQTTAKHSAAPTAPVVASDEAAIAALNNQTGPRREHQAESLVIDAAPATITIEVSVDARGAPNRCTVKKSSGHRSLDHAVCRAALRPVYSAPQADR